MSEPNRDRDLLLSLWREASQHIDIAACIEQLVPLLSKHIPADAVVVRRLDVEALALETVAAVRIRGISLPPSQRTDLVTAELDVLSAWIRRGELMHANAGEMESRHPALLPAGALGDVIAIPLQGSNGVLGVLLLIAHAPRRFAPDVERTAASLREPLSATLANDWRAREMQVQRAAAEADRQALLSRLGRRAISEEIVGAESGLHGAMDRVERVARLDVPVLILGETGSGKEVLARAIHARSRRSEAPFIRVNCGAIPIGLIDSELFGHERGSFTGAIGERKGWFERADKGTLFLDEIGELPLDAQVRLLRVLQDGTLERVGGHRPISVDVRIVAATHRNLRSMIANGQFREDLWYRIAVFGIDIPPLRERLDDIPDLARHFAIRAATRFGRPAIAPTAEDLALLVRYPWPGNVRELGAVLERAVILGDGRRLEVARALGPIPSSGSPAAAQSQLAAPTGERFLTLDEASARHIRLALDRTRGRIEGRNGAAALLGVNPHTLRGRMRRLRIEWHRFRDASVDEPGLQRRA